MRILAVDISNVFRRNWEASQGKEFSAAHDRTVQAVARFREGHDRVAICCDGGKSFRKAISPEYKANRSDPGEGYREQLRRTIERLQADGCTILRSPEVEGGFAEADDVIGSLCKWAQEMGHSVSIVSADKDILQCVTSKDADPVVCRITPDKGEVHFAEQVKEALGVPPEQIANWLALCGDSSDGYKPYPKLGPTGAAALLNKFGSLPPIVLHATAEQMNEVLGNMPLCQRIKEIGPDPCFAALKLATLRCDLPLDFGALEADPQTQSLSQPPVAEVIEAPKVAEPELARPSVALAVQEPRTTQVQRAQKCDPWNLQPSGSRGLVELARAFVDARCFPNVGSESQVIAVTVIAQNLGVPMGIAMQHAYFVHGRLAWSAAFITGLVRRSPECEKFYIVESTDLKAVVRYKRRGEPEDLYEYTFARAEREGLTKPTRSGEPSMWTKRPRVMCRWAALRECARMVFPDLVAGLYCRDEIDAGGDYEEAA